ncbi:bacteriocin immunity protein [Lactobacillus sp. CC-MHH1034]|uniref:bacteriocin immunity protein n=1 Tax=Agrilactobacillus fermenti TaxID=2586909 RepID=UPI001E416FDA|nr:bacteriocin immunity protein [Agrilactobacillus fermenti]MCD2257468.1 bacteriocin immunity protein [Agrilactobacillus fermenti]
MDISHLLKAMTKWTPQTSELLDITDVLAQVYQKIDTAKNPEALVNRLVNYIRIVSSKGRLHFPPAEEKLMIDLGAIGQRAGLNGSYMADFSDKSQFYSYTEQIPRR